MKQLVKLAVSLLTLSLYFTVAIADDNLPQVLVKTNMGDFVIELDKQKAPASVANFLGYVNEGFYNGTVFHRVIDGFMIQGGGFNQDLTKKNTRAPIKNEANNGLKNLKGTLAMARTNDPHSATAQFFINVVNNGFLDYKSATSRGWGYAVFGKVVQGLDVIEKIRKVPTGPGGQFPRDVPKSAVIMESVTVITHK